MSILTLPSINDSVLTCKETRIIVTNRCNYHCVFCHNEGNTKTKSKQDQNSVQLQRAIREIIANGCRDITFTGGEPLMKHKLLFETIQYIRSIDQTLPITIVTNASLLRPRLLDTFANFGNIRFNISFHTTKQSKYSFLTKQKFFSLNGLCERLEKIRNRNIPFKMNAVILRSTMNDARSVNETIDFARKNGAIACKLIELIIVKQNESFIDEYLAAETVEKHLPDNFRLTEETERARIFEDNNGFKVELQKCRCHFGCEQCTKKSLTASLDVQGNFWSCFFRTDLKDNLVEIGYQETIRRGNKCLQTMLERYGQYSPSLTRPIEMVPEYRQVWFQLDSEQTLHDIVAQSNQHNTRTFEEFFFKRNSSNANENESIVVIHSVHHNPQNAGLILADVTVKQQGGLPVNHIKFFDPKGSPVRGNKEYIHRFLSRLGWTEYFSVKTYERQFFYNKAQFSIQLVNDNQNFAYVNVDNEDGQQLAMNFARRTGIKPLALPYQEIMQITRNFSTNGILES